MEDRHEHSDHKSEHLHHEHGRAWASDDKPPSVPPDTGDATAAAGNPPPSVPPDTDDEVNFTNAAAKPTDPPPSVPPDTD